MKLLVISSVAHPQIVYEVDALRQTWDLDFLVEESISMLTVLRQCFRPFLKRLPLVLLSLARLRIVPFHFNYFLYAQQAARIIDSTITRQLRYDAIYSHWLFPAGFIGLIVGRALGARVISTVWGYDIQTVRGQQSYGIANSRDAAFSRQIMRASDVVVVNNASHEFTATRLIGADLSYKIVHLPPALPDLSQLIADSAAKRFRDKLGIPAKARIILYSPSLRPHYGITEFVDAAPLVSREVPDAFFVVLGEGELKTIAIEGVKRMQLTDRFLFLGKLPHEAVLLLYTCSEIVCDLSYAGHGTTTLEAICFGKAVIAIDSTKRIVEHGKNGFVVPRGDAHALAKQIVRILRDTKLRRAIGENARVSFELKYAMASRVQSITALLRSSPQNETLRSRKQYGWTSIVKSGKAE